MDLVLTRQKYGSDGIFGELTDYRDNFVCHTLEHAYQIKKSPGVITYKPKIPGGKWTCLRGQHKLAHSEQPFSTFEVTEIDGHSGIVFHAGNYNKDSDGCILLGTGIMKDPTGGSMLINSRVAFSKFMEMQATDMMFYLLVIP